MAETGPTREPTAEEESWLRVSDLLTEMDDALSDGNTHWPPRQNAQKKRTLERLAHLSGELSDTITRLRRGT